MKKIMMFNGFREKKLYEEGIFLNEDFSEFFYSDQKNVFFKI